MTLVEAVRNDLARLPPEMRVGGIAQSALLCAQALDQGDLLPRDFQALIRELRLALAHLQDTAPGDRRGDTTDEVRRKREERLAGGKS